MHKLDHLSTRRYIIPLTFRRADWTRFLYSAPATETRVFQLLEKQSTEPPLVRNSSLGFKCNLIAAG